MNDASQPIRRPVASGEFALIDRFFGARTAARLNAQLPVGIGDDCAALSVAADATLLTSVDTLVEGVHFLAAGDPVALGHKSLAVNLSDLAACGAVPLACLLALTLPRVWNDERYGMDRESFLQDFAAGFRGLSERYACPLVGGDTTGSLGQGPVVISVTVFGTVPGRQASRMLRRAEARPGDDIWVSGELGAAAWAVERRSALDGVCHDPQWTAACARLDRPTPRVELGLALGGVARAAIDLSDGLAGDLSHILQASAVGAELDERSLPFAAVLQTLPTADRWRLGLQGGDDYELCWTAPPTQRAAIEAIAVRLDLPLRRIGRIVDRRGLLLRTLDDHLIPLEVQAYDHFPV
ncbi:MAG: thiamine-phosphate kinase [Burkholderiaceae bacterium]|jgi:thiamine-monophosphate kinase